MARVAGKIIAHILRIIESAIHRIPPQNPMPPTFIKQEEFVFCEQSERLSVPPAWRAGYIPSRFKNKIDKHDIR